MGSEAEGRCWNCGAELISSDYGRENNCLKCGKPTRVCRNCRWYAPGRANECEEPVAERVMEKERPNFCDFFEPTEAVGEGGTASSAPDLLKSAEDFFKT